MSESIVHPVTGEIVPDTLNALTAAERAVDVELRGLRPLYRFRDALQARVAELRGPAVLPVRARRTDVQRRVASCPRCGGVLGKPLERAA
jgi:hypothetical protein